MDFFASDFRFCMCVHIHSCLICQSDNLGSGLMIIVFPLVGLCKLQPWSLSHNQKIDAQHLYHLSQTDLGVVCVHKKYCQKFVNVKHLVFFHFMLLEVFYSRHFQQDSDLKPLPHNQQLGPKILQVLLFSISSFSRCFIPDTFSRALL